MIASPQTVLQIAASRLKEALKALDGGGAARAKKLILAAIQDLEDLLEDRNGIDRPQEPKAANRRNEIRIPKIAVLPSSGT